MSQTRPGFHRPAQNGKAMPESSMVAPEALNGTVDYSAFHTEKTSLYLGLFPCTVIHQMQDQSSVEKRQSAIVTIQEIIQNANEKELEENLQDIVSLITLPLSDANFKIVLTGLQLLEEVVTKTKEALLPYLNVLLSNYLAKVGSHKYIVKQAGMKVLMKLMEVLRPEPVVKEVIGTGLVHKQAKVREETLNIIIASLLTFPKSEFKLLLLVEKITPLLIDTKQRVRQACLEACAVLADRLGRECLQPLVSAVASIERSENRSELSLMLAFQARLSRKQLPYLNEHGLVDHILNVANGRNPGELCGSDVDWILAGKSTSPSANGRKLSTSGPLKSAGRKLPWDKPHQEQPPKVPTMGYASYALKQQPLKPFTSSVSGASITSTKNRGYLDIYKMSTEGTMTATHISMDSHSKAATTSILTASTFKIGKSIFDNGAQATGKSIAPCSIGPVDTFSTTWPRPNGYSTTFMRASRQISADATTLPGNFLFSPTKTGTLPAINSRPLSKPIVRNPLDFRPQPPPQASPLPSHPIINQTNDTHTVHKTISPTLIEQSFLGGEVDDDSEYYNIPVDDSLLNSSLSSSLTSLFVSKELQSTKGGREAKTVDALSQIRKKAASWKAEILSTQCSTSTSPVGTPPQSSQGPKLSQSITGKNTGRTEISTVSAPVVLKKGKQPKKKSPVKMAPLPQSPPPLLPPPLHESSIYGSSNSVLDRTFTIDTKEDAPQYLDQFGLRTSTEDYPRMMENETTTTMKPKATRTKAPHKKQQPTFFSSPVKEPFDTLSNVARHLSHSHISDLELNPPEITDRLSPPKYVTSTHKYKEVTPPNRKTKKTSPAKTASAPQKSSMSTSPTSSISNSAPVYRPGTQNPDVIDESKESQDLVELEPLPHPESSLRKALQGLGKGTEEWEEKCEALLILRRLSAFHDDIILPQLHTILIEVEKEVRNLRSQVARHAIACLGDMFAFLKRDMEQSLDAIVKTLLQVGSKSNNFYREDTEKALLEMTRNTSPAKSLQAVITGGISHGSVLVRRQVAQLICVIVEQSGPSKIMKLPRDVLDKTFNAIAHLLGDADAVARYQARRTLDQLYSCLEFDTTASRALSKHQYSKVKESVESIKTKGLGKPPLDSQSAKTTRLSLSSHPSSAAQPTVPTTSQSPPKTRKRRISAQPVETGYVTDTTVPLPDDLLVKMKASDWKERQEAITDLEIFIQSYPMGLGSNVVKVFDVFNERLNDKNSKVNLYALQTFQRFVPILNQQLQPVLSTLVEALAGTVASRYPAIHSAALDAVDTLMSTVDCTLLFPPLASAAQNGNTRVQPIMLRKLAELVPRVYDQKPALLQRVGLPVLWKMLSARSPATGEAKMAILRLCESLYLCLGPNLQASAAQLSPAQEQRLMDLLRTLSHNR